MKIEILECGDVKITSENLIGGMPFVIVGQEDLVRMINKSLDDSVFCDKDGNKKSTDELKSLWKN